MLQYRKDRPPRVAGSNAVEPLLAFPQGALVHFALSNSAVRMTTRLDGFATVFLPFDKGDAGAAGNPPNPAGYATDYLWKAVWAHWRAALRHSYEAISALEQPIDPAHRRQWETLNVRFHEALLSGNDSPWTQKVLGLLARHGERYRRYAMGLPGSVRDVHAEHTEIFEHALAGREARAALALEAHIRATPDLLAQALRTGQLTLPPGAAAEAAPALLAG